MTVKQLKFEYKENLAKQMLAEQFDACFVQASALPDVPQLLGKHFYGNDK